MPPATEPVSIPERHLAQFAGLLQADAYDGYNRLYLPDRKPGPITEALCWSHARRKFFELADIATMRDEERMRRRSRQLHLKPSNASTHYLTSSVRSMG